MKRPMNYYSPGKSGILFKMLLLLLMLGCDERKTESTIVAEAKGTALDLEDVAPEEIDSLTISVKLGANQRTGINVTNEHFATYYLSFINEDSTSTIIERKIPKYSSGQILQYGTVIYAEGAAELRVHYLLADSTATNVHLINTSNELKLPDEDTLRYVVNALVAPYDSLLRLINTSTRTGNVSLLTALEETYQTLQKRYRDQPLFLQLNDDYYYYLLQELDPANTEILAYLKNMKYVIAGGALTLLLRDYVTNRMDSLIFTDLDQSGQSDQLSSLLTRGVYLYLINSENRSHPRYFTALEWLKTTEMYQQDSIKILADINIIDPGEFKRQLMSITLTDTNDKTTNLSEVISGVPSDYYLLDFWATWCKPCIEGVRVMEEKGVPGHVRVISLSLDKPNMGAAWKKLTRALGQESTYLVTEDEFIDDFVNLMRLNTIPRYIVIDADLNLVDEAFLPPHDPRFVDRLNNLK